MHLDWMILTNYAEAPPNSGLVHMMGAGWDTIHAHGPAQAPEGAVAVIQGFLVCRLLFHSTEIPRERSLRIAIVDEDGNESGKIEGTFTPDKPAEGAPWEHGIHLVFPLTGLPLASFGLHQISLLVDEQHLGDRGFRVVREY